MMSNQVKVEYIKVLNEFEATSKKFEGLEQKTKMLKELYKQTPNDEALLQEIKMHEQEYKATYEKFVELNSRAKKLKAISDAEADDNE